jgi:hypothetical protein
VRSRLGPVPCKPLCVNSRRTVWRVTYMAWYTSSDNCINTLPLPSGWLNQIVDGQHLVNQEIASCLLAGVDRLKRPVFSLWMSIWAPCWSHSSAAWWTRGTAACWNFPFVTSSESSRSAFWVPITEGRTPSSAGGYLLQLENCDNIVLPACFGEYICENPSNSPREIVKTLLINRSTGSH